jgi:hypothetical protein
LGTTIGADSGISEVGLVELAAPIALGVMTENMGKTMKASVINANVFFVFLSSFPFFG